jgi:ribosomal protein S18 acetylase RimI-like enzyme
VALRSPPEPPSPTVVRPLRPDDAGAVRGVAAAAFAGYLGHYHTDPRLDRAKADETYADWAYRICSSRVVGSEVWVAERGGDVVGFLAVQEIGSGEVEIVLNGVAPASQRSGVYRLLLDTAVDWSRDRKAARLIISTQLNNQRAQRAWIRAGFLPRSAQQTFHVWFPR